MFPRNQCLHRLRTNEGIRSLVRETHFSKIHLGTLIQPLFIEEAITHPAPIASMPGIFRIPEHLIAKEILELYELGIRSVMPFGISHNKDGIGSDTWQDDGLLARMIIAIKKACPEMLVIPDICFCEYTSHGHCGVLLSNKKSFANGQLSHEATLINLAKQSLVAAKAGADMLAPSSMIDKQVAIIRAALDNADFDQVAILAHSAKFASAFYGPFRAAVSCSINSSQDDRNTYQLDPANRRQALLEAKLDEAEGADILMVKPGLPYLDVLSALRSQTNLPIAGYQVSGEYSSIKFAALAGAINEKNAVFESILALRRAGADIIVSYFAKSIALWLQ